MATVGLLTLVIACKEAEVVKPGSRTQTEYVAPASHKGIILATHPGINGDSLTTTISIPTPVNVDPAPVSPTVDPVVLPEIEVKN